MGLLKSVERGPKQLHKDTSWQQWVPSFGSMFHASLEQLRAWRDESEGFARVHERKFTTERGRRWREWAQEAVSAGAGKARKYSQCPIGWAPPESSTIKAGGFPVPLGPQESKPHPDASKFPDPVQHLTCQTQAQAAERGASVQELCSKERPVVDIRGAIRKLPKRTA
eukprot:488563-Pyramimonas_sp.AAC.1